MSKESLEFCTQGEPYNLALRGFMTLNNRPKSRYELSLRAAQRILDFPALPSLMSSAILQLAPSLQSTLTSQLQWVSVPHFFVMTTIVRGLTVIRSMMKLRNGYCERRYFCKQASKATRSHRFRGFFVAQTVI